MHISACQCVNFANIYLYIYMYVCMCIYIYIVIDIYTYTYVTNSHEIYSHIIKPLQIQEEFTSPIAGNKILGLQKKAPSLSTTFLSSCLSTDSALGPPELVQLSVDTSRESGRFLPSLRPNRGGSEKLVAM